MKTKTRHARWLYLLLPALWLSCERKIEEPTEETDQIRISTEVVVDGEAVARTRAQDVAGITTGDGLYHQDEEYTVSATAKEGYALVRFYEKSKTDPTLMGKTSYKERATRDRIYRAEFQMQHPPLVVGGTNHLRTFSDYNKGVKLEWPTDQPVRGIAAGNSRWAIITGNKIFSSKDGINWDESVSIPVSDPEPVLNCIIHANGRFVALGYQNGQTRVWSADDRTLEWRELPSPRADIASKKWVALTTGFSGMLTALSSDGYTVVTNPGETWGDLQPSSSAQGGINKVVYDPDIDKYYVIGNHGFLRSREGRARVWSTERADFSGANLIDIACNDGMCVIIGSDGRAFYKNDLGWYESSPLPSVDGISQHDLRAVTYEEDEFVAVSSAGHLFSSTDGAHWEVMYKNPTPTVERGESTCIHFFNSLREYVVSWPSYHLTARFSDAFSSTGSYEVFFSSKGDTEIGVQPGPLRAFPLETKIRVEVFSNQRSIAPIYSKEFFLSDMRRRKIRSFVPKTLLVRGHEYHLVVSFHTPSMDSGTWFSRGTYRWPGGTTEITYSPGDPRSYAIYQ